MHIFIQQIPLNADLDQLEKAIASKLHKPPFQTTPPINFHIKLFPAKRRGQTGRRGIFRHGGIARLTLPNSEIGSRFLALYGLGGAGIQLMGQMIRIGPDTKPPDEGLIRRVASEAWVQRPVKDTTSSQPIELRGYAFGRICRDGAFSAEYQGHGSVRCEMEARRIKIITEETIATSPPVQSNDRLLGVLANFLQLDLTGSTTNETSFWYPSSHLLGMAHSESNNVFLEFSNPPTFQHLTDDDTMRLSSPKKKVTSASMPPIGRLLCLSFRSCSDAELFIRRCRKMHHVYKHDKDLSLVSRDVYNNSHLVQLGVFLSRLDFPLAFELQKLVLDGNLEPREVYDDLGNEIQDLQRHHPSDAPLVIRIFASDVKMVSLDPRSNSGDRNTLSSEVDLHAELSAAIKQHQKNLLVERRRFRASPSVYQSYHLIITPSTRYCEGPFPDVSNVVLRHFGHNESFLRVSFQDELRCKPRRSPDLLIDQLLDLRYKEYLTKGVTFAGRNYQFLGYSMSGLREYSFNFVTPFYLEGELMTPKKILNRLGDFSLLTREPARLAARRSQLFSASTPSVTLKGESVDVQYTNDIRRNGSVFTDGCSSISHALCLEVWNKLGMGPSKRPFDAIQFRQGGAKGMLVRNPKLTGLVMQIRPSQKKFDAPQNLTLNITGHSRKPILCFLNRPLIALLEHHGVPDKAFTDLQDLALERAENICKSFQFAASILPVHGLGSSFRLPSLLRKLHDQASFDISPGTNVDHSTLNNQLINQCLRFSAMHIYRELKYNARIPVPGSVTLLGVSDEWDCLQEGEIFATIHYPLTDEVVPIQGRILITRSPQIHPGDVQFVNAVRRDQLMHLRNVVVFSCRGARSLPSCLGGGDLDGDIYNLILDESLYPPKMRTADPGAYTPTLPRQTLLDCTDNDIADFVIDYMRSDLLGYICNLHLRISDLKGHDDLSCLDLAKAASQAVDFPKVGVAVDFRTLPRTASDLKPDYMSGEGNDLSRSDKYYPSEKTLGKLFRRVPKEPPELLAPKDYDQCSSLDFIKMRSVLEHLAETAGFVMPDFSEIDIKLRVECSIIMDEYKYQLQAIGRKHTTSRRPNASISEAELVSGTIVERYSDERVRGKAIMEMNNETRELVTQLRYELTNGPSDSTNDDNSTTLAPEEKFLRALTAWLVAKGVLDLEAEKATSNEEDFGAQSFELVALETLLGILEKEEVDEMY